MLQRLRVGTLEGKYISNPICSTALPLIQHTTVTKLALPTERTEKLGSHQGQAGASQGLGDDIWGFLTNVTFQARPCSCGAVHVGAGGKTFDDEITGTQLDSSLPSTPRTLGRMSRPACPRRNRSAAPGAMSRVSSPAANLVSC